MNYIYVHNLNDEKYSHTFRTFKILLNIFPVLGYELTDDKSKANYSIISQRDFVYPELTLEESIEKGSELVKSFENVILYDSTDSTSLQGIIEVLENCSNVVRLVKHQILDREEYSKPAPFGKWFFSGLIDNEDCIWSKEISEETYNKIELSYLNIFFWTFRKIQQFKKTGNDIFGVFGSIAEKDTRFKHSDAVYYNAHRNKARDIIKALSYSSYTDKVDSQQYYYQLANSKISVSPYGMGELCLRDVESWYLGTPLIKPDVTKVKTLPIIWLDGLTYTKCKPDLSDLEEIIDTVLYSDSYQERLVNNAYKLISSNFSDGIINRWYDILCK